MKRPAGARPDARKSAAKKPAPRKQREGVKVRAAAKRGSSSGRAPPAAPVEESRQEEYVFKLYVTGVTTASTLATERIRAICEVHLPGRHRLEVIDIHQLPGLARQDQIVATPTLIRVLPPPLRRLIGSLANEEKILVGLDLHKK
jgi:circadian clock protein KaiB